MPSQAQLVVPLAVDPSLMSNCIGTDYLAAQLPGSVRTQDDDGGRAVPHLICLRPAELYDGLHSRAGCQHL